MKFDIALIKGSYADERGNISLENDYVPTEVMSIAQAVHNCGGKVIVQVDKIVKTGSLDPKLVKVPGIYVDYVVEIQEPDRKSTRLNSSHANISYAVFCLKKKKTPQHNITTLIQY